MSFRPQLADELTGDESAADPAHSLAQSPGCGWGQVVGVPEPFPLALMILWCGTKAVSIQWTPVPGPVLGLPTNDSMGVADGAGHDKPQEEILSDFGGCG